MLILEIAAGVILGQFVYQYLVDDLIQAYLKKKALKKLEAFFGDVAAPNLGSILNKVKQQKQDLH